MQHKIKCTFIIVLVLFLLLLVGCSDKKSPEKGYLSEEEMNEVISNLKTKTVSKYSISGTLNYFGMPETEVENSVYKHSIEFVDSPEYFDTTSSSYYLRLPLHITKTSWTSDKESDTGLSLSTKYQLESKIYRPEESLDSVYYYHRDGGGFYAKVFGANKGLIIFKKDSITCRAKWNIVVEYDEYGFLVSEDFQTINSSEKNKEDCCYGKATYQY